MSNLDIPGAERYLRAVKNLHRNTVYTIVRRLRYIDANVISLTQDAVIDLIDKYKQQIGPSSTNGLIVAWGHYIDFLVYTDNPCPFKKLIAVASKGKPARDFLTAEQMREIAEVWIPYNQNREYLNGLFKMIFMFYALTGARVSELLNLKVKDVSLEEKNCWFFETKTGDPRKVLLPDELVFLLTPYCTKDGERYVVESARGGRYDSQDINDELKRRARAVGMERHVHVHLFRHSFVSLLLHAGVELPTIAKMIGHRNINTTYGTYGHLVDKMFRVALDRHPLVRDRIDPESILKQDLEEIKKLRIFSDPRFTHSVTESGNSIELRIAIDDVL